MPSGSVLTADSDGVHMDGRDFARVHMRDFLSGLSRRAEKRDATMVEYKRRSLSANGSRMPMNRS